jgi:3-hydroxyisobutyrate dehydrogenase-like beta-hydroxyacid dehydrogenase
MACRSYVVMRCSTVESTTAMALGELPEKAGAVLVDATLCLGEPAAEDASMLIMCGRDDAALDRIDPCSQRSARTPTAWAGSAPAKSARC